MHSDDTDTDALERRLGDVMARLEPRDELAARRRLLGEYDHLQQRARSRVWRVPAAMAAGLLLGILGSQLADRLDTGDRAVPPLAGNQIQAGDDGSTRLLGRQKVDVQKLLDELERADADTWMETIAARLQAHDWQSARVLIDAFEQKFPHVDRQPPVRLD